MIIKFVKRYIGILFVFTSFIVLDFYTRMNVPSSGVVRFKSISPNLFTISWICILISIILLLKPKVRKIVYVSLISFFSIMFLVNNIYYSVFNSFFSFKNLGLTGEGKGYILSVLKSIDITTLFVFILIILLVLLSIKLLPKNKLKIDIAASIFLIVISFISYSMGLRFLGDGVDNMAWDSWNYKKNIYDNFTETKKSMQISGLYQYIARDIYFTYLKGGSKSLLQDIIYLDEYFNSNQTSSINNEEIDSIYEVTFMENERKNSYFKDKNVVIVMMESIDEWLINKEVMPTVYKMMKNGINFTNHYSPIYGGGATFNSEFMINTGYMTPFNGGLASYTYSDNTYSNSLANIFKNSGYDVNNFHFNTGEFYNRTSMTKAFGYNNYYSALELGYSNSLFDSTFMKEEELKNKMLPNEKFMTFFTTYSAHMPYSLNDGLCSQMNIDNKYLKDGIEVACLKTQAKETDYFFELLLSSLKEKGLFDNTIIIGITDHYSYALEDKEYLFNMKNTDDPNLLSKTPFFIWGNDIEKKQITKVNSSIDILPTILNLFELDHNPKHYLGKDILDDNYNGYVFFSDYSWYDGNVYYKDNKNVFDFHVEQEYVEYIYNNINIVLDINKKVLETNYFKVKQLPIINY